jgi:hypothetical protein
MPEMKQKLGRKVLRSVEVKRCLTFIPFDHYFRLHHTQARITLARAIYCTAEILLLDDVCELTPTIFDITDLRAQVLAALDVHTAKHIVEKCFSGDLVYGRTIILVVC